MNLSGCKEIDDNTLERDILFDSNHFASIDITDSEVTEVNLSNHPNFPKLINRSDKEIRLKYDWIENFQQKIFSIDLKGELDEKARLERLVENILKMLVAFIEKIMFPLMRQFHYSKKKDAVFLI